MKIYHRTNAQDFLHPIDLSQKSKLNIRLEWERNETYPQASTQHPYPQLVSIHQVRTKWDTKVSQAI